tara:strand:+ start:865 stop:1062 length:198 start_codon:yes stop_codon:yes gene_type:complete
MDKRERFLKELHELLAKYDADIIADDHWKGYAECGQDIRMIVSFYGDHPSDDIDLGSFVDQQGHG